MGMKTFTKLTLAGALIALVAQASIAQSGFAQISAGPMYSQQAYFNLAQMEAVETIENTDWDIAFTAVGFQDAGILVNEATAFSFADPLPEVELYHAPTDDFNDNVDPAVLGERLFNDEASWLYGAGNAGRDESNIADYGWGTYDGGSMTVIGEQVFVIKLRSGAYKKFMIESLAITTYNVKYADLDGGNETTVTIDKNVQAGALALFSFDQGSVIASPTNWDILFTRYYTILDDNGTLVDYNVTGVHSGPETQVAVIDGVNPDEVDLGYAEDFSSQVDLVGWDWKFFSFQDGWILDTDISYLIKVGDGTVYRIHFFDFEGSSTGIASFEWAELGILNTAETNPDLGVKLAPNPVSQGLTADLMLELAHRELSRVRGVSNALGLEIHDLERLLALSVLTPSGLSQKMISELQKLGQIVQIGDRNLVDLLRKTSWWGVPDYEE
ncbi:MAG: HmuY family protein, partial [Bacteroidota bacterium]